VFLALIALTSPIARVVCPISHPLEVVDKSSGQIPSGKTKLAVDLVLGGWIS
jgi:hypothetical protein